MNILQTISTPKDIKSLNILELKELAKEIRQVILDTVLKNGGHLASSLGAVEIIIAMHYVFDAPADKFIFDVGHQCLAHKLLTGRYNDFNTLRVKGGLSGFPKRSESCYDTVNTGHSSTSLSVACGISRALKLENSNAMSVSLIGDGALTGGLAYEALNDSDEIGHKQIVILNDNSMSISENVGSTAKYLLKLHGNDVYRRVKSGALNLVGDLNIKNRDKSLKFLYNAKNSVKYFLQGGMPFEQFGLRYFGPIDGHNIEQLINALKIAKEDDDSVIIHVVTKKGRGYLEAEQNPAKYHGYSPCSGAKCVKTFSTAFGEAMEGIASESSKVFALTASMREGVGLEGFSQNFHDRFADVGIAEAHATTSAVGLALMGYKPYFAVYSSFLQRAYDQIVHDVCLQDLPITFCIDRAGIVPGDGETHQGIYDVAFLRSLPNMTLVCPKSCEDLKSIINWSLEYKHPLAIRYPKGGVKDIAPCLKIELGKWEKLNDGDINAVLLATGAKMVETAMEVAKELAECGILIEVENAMFIKPMDESYLLTLAGKKIFTLEDNLLAGGFGACVLEFFNRFKIMNEVTMFGIDDLVLEHATVSELQKIAKIDKDSIVKKIKNEINIDI